MERYLILFFGMLLLNSCERDYSVYMAGNSQIVVEGSIESGDYANVVLMRSVPIGEKVDSTTVGNYVLRSAKVVVSDGTNEEVLVLKSDKSRIPPYVYYGSELKGEEGKTYTLKIYYLDRILESTTTIPATVPIKSVSYHQEDSYGVTGYLNLEFDDPPQKNYYQILTKVEDDEPVFVPAFYGNLDDSKFTSPDVKLQINRGILMSKYMYYPYFNYGNVIDVKLRTSEKPAYDFWNDYQNEVLNGKNPIFPSTSSLRSNIKGGIGLWAGYGQNTVTIEAK